MELCSDNLQNILKYKHEIFDRNKSKQINQTEYSISCRIFIELIEALNYLHKQSPPILHRDIKPGNILFSDKGTETGIFFKLCDFGLAKLYDGKINTENINTKTQMNSTNVNTNDTSMSSSNTKEVGTYKYMAPEVRYSRKYDTKADVYSLGIVAQELFCLKNNYERNNELGMFLAIIEDVVKDMIDTAENRPNCRKILDEHDKWLPKMTSYEFSMQELPECHSLNIYTEYHVNLCK